MMKQTALIIALMMMALTGCGDNASNLADNQSDAGTASEQNSAKEINQNSTNPPAGISVDLGDVKFGLGADDNSGGINAQLGDGTSFSMGANDSSGNIQGNVGGVKFKLSSDGDSGGISVDMGDGKKFSLGSPNETNQSQDSTQNNGSDNK